MRMPQGICPARALTIEGSRPPRTCGLVTYAQVSSAPFYAKLSAWGRTFAVNASTEWSNAMNRIVTLDTEEAAARPAALADMRALVLLPSADALRIPRAEMVERFGAVEIVTATTHVLTDLARRPDMLSRTVLILDLEAMGGIGAAFETLRGLRTLYPQVVVVLVAPHAGAQDFGRTRLQICDVTLGNTPTGEDLDLALFAGLRNNVAWRARLAEASAPDADVA